jgi:hypothetical protein
MRTGARQAGGGFQRGPVFVEAGDQAVVDAEDGTAEEVCRRVVHPHQRQHAAVVQRETSSRLMSSLRGNALLTAMKASAPSSVRRWSTTSLHVRLQQGAGGRPVARLHGRPQGAHGAHAGRQRQAHVVDVPVAFARSSQSRGAGRSGWPRCPSAHTVPAAAGRGRPVHRPRQHLVADALALRAGSMYRWFSRSTCDRRLSTTKPTRWPSTTMCRVWSGAKPSARRLRARCFVVAAQVLQAGAHGAQAQRQQFSKSAALAPTSVSPGRSLGGHPATAWRMCSSTSLALTGIGVPGP